MLPNQIFFWNVRGLNSRACRDVVREFLLQERASVACLTETKIVVLRITMVYDLMGTGFDYVCLPAQGASGGIILGWDREV
jgi:exonuclease III